MSIWQGLIKNTLENKINFEKLLKDVQISSSYLQKHLRHKRTSLGRQNMYGLSGMNINPIIYARMKMELGKKLGEMTSVLFELIRDVLLEKEP